MSDHAQRIEKSRQVDYMGADEFKTMQREENEETQETEQSFAEARKEISDRKNAETSKMQAKIEAARIEKQLADLKEAEAKKAQKAQVASASFI